MLVLTLNYYFPNLSCTTTYNILLANVTPHNIRLSQALLAWPCELCSIAAPLVAPIRRSIILHCHVRSYSILREERTKRPPLNNLIITLLNHLPSSPSHIFHIVSPTIRDKPHHTQEKTDFSNLTDSHTEFIYHRGTSLIVSFLSIYWY